MSSLIRYSRPFSVLLDEVENNLNHAFSLYPTNNQNRDYWLPEIDVKEQNNSYLIKMDLPGMDKKDVKISIDQQNNLVISGERETASKKERKDYICFERYKGSFFRKVPLPGTVDAQHITAKYRDGVLEITVPRAQEHLSKQIAIED